MVAGVQAVRSRNCDPIPDKEQEIFKFIFQSVKTGCGTHLASHSVRAGYSFLGVKVAWA
jgi:hypothetical protein